MNNDKIKALIFDMDGVIVDSEPIHRKAEIQTCIKFGMKVPQKEWENFRGKRLEDIFSYVCKKYGTGKESIEKMIQFKIDLYLSCALSDMNLVPGVYEFLLDLKRNTNYSLAITTSGRKIQQDKILNKFNLKHFFEIMVTAEDVEHGKPHPEPYLITVKKLKEDSENCLVIEDSDNGILSAKRAGCIACGITTTFNEKTLKLAGADVIIENFIELKNSSYFKQTLF
ncbi:MAG: HAD family phosphatase [Patescibacteria group bacterium]|jgi:sugar-phosphatase